MADNLYEELGISKDATQEEVRKAYKKKALLTHPDRLRQGATAAEKAASEERFRKVNNAYEVLSDPTKRNEYNIHGVWPPPEEEEEEIPTWTRGTSYRPHSHARGPSRGHTFPDPFFSRHNRGFHAFEFTDPFALFDAIFEGTPFQTSSSRHRHPFFSRPMNPFDQLHQLQAEIEGFMDDIDRDPFGGGFPRFGPTNSMPTAFPSIDMPSFPNRHGRGGGTRWVSESYMTSIVNGVTQTIQKRVDSDGNEHVTRTLPDGRQYRTINGVDQSPHGHLPYPDPSKTRRLPDSSSNRYPTIQTTSHPQPMASTSRTDYGTRPLPPPAYPGPPQVYRDALPVDNRSRLRRGSDKYTYPTNTVNPHDSHPQEERHRKKSWWGGRH